MGQWGTDAGNCSRVLVTSMKVSGLLCRHRSVGSRGLQAGRCHLHDPEPPLGRGANHPGWFPSGSCGAGAQLTAEPDIGPSFTPCITASSGKRARFPGTSLGSAVLQMSWLCGPALRLLPGPNPSPSPDGKNAARPASLRTARWCRLWTAGVPWAAGRGLNRLEPQPSSTHHPVMGKACDVLPGLG